MKFYEPICVQNMTYETVNGYLSCHPLKKICNSVEDFAETVIDTNEL